MSTPAATPPQTIQSTTTADDSTTVPGTGPIFHLSLKLHSEFTSQSLDISTRHQSQRLRSESPRAGVKMCLDFKPPTSVLPLLHTCREARAEAPKD
jgi:hypothetical protein